MLPNARKTCSAAGIHTRASCGYRKPLRRMPKRQARHNLGTFSLPMACIHFTSTAHLRRAAFTAASLVRACVLRALQTQRHGMPTAFVSLSGVTAMLSSAVRKD